jgi:hypothetical protein
MSVGPSRRRARQVRRGESEAVAPRGSTVLSLSALALAGCALALAACGSSTGTGGTTGSASASAGAGAGVRFTQCMRAHGVTEFPDPLPSGGFPRGPGVEQSAPAFHTARKACQRILGPNAVQHEPTAAAMASALKFSECMRAHRVPNFPDPMTRSQGPRNTDVLIQGDVIFPVGSSIDPGSPAFQQAASACGGGPPRGAPHGG